VPGSLPLPPQSPEGELTLDPFAAAHGSKPRKSYQEPETDFENDDAE
jgi:NADH-quinone oxidoreductase subunit C